MTKEEFIAKLQMVYVGDKNAFNELVYVYSNLLERKDKAIEYLKETTFDFGTDEMIFDKCNAYTLLSILQSEEVK